MTSPRTTTTETRGPQRTAATALALLFLAPAPVAALDLGVSVGSVSVEASVDSGGVDSGGVDPSVGVGSGSGESSPSEPSQPSSPSPSQPSQSSNPSPSQAPQPSTPAPPPPGDPSEAHGDGGGRPKIRRSNDRAPAEAVAPATSRVEKPAPGRRTEAARLEALIELVDSCSLADLDLEKAVDDRRVIVIETDRVFGTASLERLETALRADGRGRSEAVIAVRAHRGLADILSRAGHHPEQVVALQVGRNGATEIFVHDRAAERALTANYFPVLATEPAMPAVEFDRCDPENALLAAVPDEPERQHVAALPTTPETPAVRSELSVTPEEEGTAVAETAAPAEFPMPALDEVAELVALTTRLDAPVPPLDPTQPGVVAVAGDDPPGPAAVPPAEATPATTPEVPTDDLVAATAMLFEPAATAAPAPVSPAATPDTDPDANDDVVRSGTAERPARARIDRLRAPGRLEPPPSVSTAPGSISQDPLHGQDPGAVPALERELHLALRRLPAATTPAPDGGTTVIETLAAAACAEFIAAMEDGTGTLEAADLAAARRIEVVPVPGCAPPEEVRRWMRRLLEVDSGVRERLAAAGHVPEAVLGASIGTRGTLSVYVADENGSGTPPSTAGMDSTSPDDVGANRPTAGKR